RLAVARLVTFVFRETGAADHHQRRSRPWSPSLFRDAVRERGAIFVGHLPDDLASPAAVAADESRAAFHRYCSPAAGKSGQISTGMSFRIALTARISSVSFPYFSSSALARL